MAHPNECKMQELLDLLAKYTKEAVDATSSGMGDGDTLQPLVSDRELKIKTLKVQIARLTSEAAAIAIEKRQDAIAATRIAAARAKASKEGNPEDRVRSPRKPRNVYQER